MQDILNIKSITGLHQYLGIEEPKHPLISLLQLKEVLNTFHLKYFKYTLGLYQISLKGNCPFVVLNYGRNPYDFEEATMLFTAPNQVLEYRKDTFAKMSNGWALFFHPDLIRKSELGKKIDQYSFFDYSVNEALHLSEDEKKTVTEITQKIKKEYDTNIDQHSQMLIVSNLELLLNYCTRFYDRQFFTRTSFNKNIVTQFEGLLKQYYQSDKPIKIGFPTVQYCGDTMNISPKYLSDLLRKETGRNTQDHIHQFIIEKAKTILLNSNKTISEIAYELGFKYPQYFSKIFKKKTKMSPNEFRNP